ncbi:MAG: replication factor [Candidatus Methanomethylophilaceae archaeon]|nr:replication factor [Candidatus Methanomethylophilaceae archaeon]
MQAGAYKPMKFEDLSEVYREEKSKNLLSEVRGDLYPAMASLLASLKADYDRLLSKDPDSIMCEGANQRRKKASRLAREIVALRMQKISSMALRAAGGAQGATEILTPEEKTYYASVLEASRVHMSSIDRMTGHVKYEIRPIDTAEEVKPPVPRAPEPQTLKDMPVFDEGPEDLSDTEEIISSPEPAGLAEEEREEPDYVLIRVLEDLPVFAGPDRDYDLKKEDLVTMPKSMADALILRNRAVLVRPSP